MTDTAFSHFAFDLIYEQQQGRLLHQAALDWFIANGVNALSLVKTPWDEYDVVNIDDVVWHTQNAFEFARYSKAKKADSACTFLVRDSLGFPLDIVAWQATTGRIATWLGRASMIGEDQIFAPRLTEGLPVFETPLGWFQEGRVGVVVIDKARAAPRLRDASPLLASSFEHGKKLNAMLRLPPPRILVPSSDPESREAA
jgi:hypothetical protein